MFSAVSWGPPSSEPNMLQINNSIRELLHKKEVVFCSFAGYPVFLVYTIYLNQNITVLVQGLREGEFRGMTRTPIFLHILY